MASPATTERFIRALQGAFGKNLLRILGSRRLWPMPSEVFRQAHAARAMFLNVCQRARTSGSNIE